VDEGKPKPPPSKAPDGVRLASLEEKARDADTQLSHLEAQSRHLRQDVDLLAQATGGLRQQSAKMREAALRVAEALTLARKRKAAKAAEPRRPHADKRPPRT
jgi:hypothetical protein